MPVSTWWAGRTAALRSQAFRRVVHIGAGPVELIPRKAADARAGDVPSEDGTCLPAASMKDGWVRVRLTDAFGVSGLRSPDGDLLLVARFASGPRVRAASAEGDDHWILGEGFPGPA